MIIQNFGDYNLSLLNQLTPLNQVNQLKSPFKLNNKVSRDNSPLSNIILKSPNLAQPKSVKNRRANSDINTIEKSIQKDTNTAKAKRKEIKLLSDPQANHNNIYSNDEAYILNRNEEYFLEIQIANQLKEMKINDIIRNDSKDISYEVIVMLSLFFKIIYGIIGTL